MNNMFSFITKTWNPIGGECQIKCCYCWARKLIEQRHLDKYLGEPRLFAMDKKFHENDFVFVSDMRDMFEPTVSSVMIQEVLEKIKTSKANFLLLTKNPRRFLEFKLPANCVAGATIETDLGNRDDRFLSMRQLEHLNKMVSIEPIMAFSPLFAESLKHINPYLVVVGYDNYRNHLDEPELKETLQLIDELEGFTEVYKKTLREKDENVSFQVHHDSRRM